MNPQMQFKSQALGSTDGASTQLPRSFFKGHFSVALATYLCRSVVLWTPSDTVLAQLVMDLPHH